MQETEKNKGVKTPVKEGIGEVTATSTIAVEEVKKEVVEKNKKTWVPTVVKLKRRKSHDWSGTSQYEDTYVRLGPSLSITGSHPVTGLTKALEAELEDDLRLEKGELSNNSKFWLDFHIPIGKSTITLRPSENMEHKLWYFFLRGDILVANSLKELETNATAEFLLTSDEEEAKEANKTMSVKRKAYIAFGAMSIADLHEMLILYGFNAEDTSPDIIDNTLGAKLEQNPIRFLDYAVDPHRKLTVLVTRLLNNGIIVREGNSQSAPIYYESTHLGDTRSEVVTFLSGNSEKCKTILKALRLQLSHI